jgi:hypothetical protein
MKMEKTPHTFQTAFIDKYNHRQLLALATSHPMGTSHICVPRGGQEIKNCCSCHETNFKCPAASQQAILLMELIAHKYNVSANRIQCERDLGI